MALTLQAICALVSQKPIITPTYLASYLAFLQGTAEKPDPFR